MGPDERERLGGREVRQKQRLDEHVQEPVAHEAGPVLASESEEGRDLQRPVISFEIINPRGSWDAFRYFHFHLLHTFVCAIVLAVK